MPCHGIWTDGSGRLRGQEIRAQPNGGPEIMRSVKFGSERTVTGPPRGQLDE
jgi:hypothetical protein